MKTLLWLDDCRNPFKNNWLRYSPIDRNCEVVWIKSYQEFVNWITINGLPDAICFDHDLGYEIDPNETTVNYYINGEISVYSLLPYNEEEKTGYDCAKWLVEYCMNTNSILPKYAIQSANPIGKENIDSLLKNFLKSQM